MNTIVNELYASLNDEMRSGSIDATPDDETAQRAVIDVLKAINGNNFAADLASKWGRYGLSPKQWYWAIKVAGQSIQPRPESIDTFIGLVDFMTAASEQLKTPKITLTIDGRTIKVARSGARSRRPGILNITDGRPYGENTWYGRVEKNGSFTPGRQYNDDVRNILVALAADPIKVTADYGKASGNCCFCNKELTDPRSKSAGYGKICAGKFGLPWGEVVATI